MTLIRAERVYTGRVLNLDADTVGFPDGSTGQLEMIRHPGASAVLPFLDDPASIHHRDAIAHARDDAEIMRNEQ